MTSKTEIESQARTCDLGKGGIRCDGCSRALGEGERYLEVRLAGSPYHFDICRVCIRVMGLALEAK